MARVRLVVGEGCHLCAPAHRAVREVCGEEFELVSISGDEELEHRYGTRIPVVEIDGVERFRYEVDESDLRDALQWHIGEADVPAG